MGSIYTPQLVFKFFRNKKICHLAPKFTKKSHFFGYSNVNCWVQNWPIFAYKVPKEALWTAQNDRFVGNGGPSKFSLLHYFSQMKCFGFMLLTRSITTMIYRFIRRFMQVNHDLRIWRHFENIQLRYNYIYLDIFLNSIYYIEKKITG